MDTARDTFYLPDGERYRATVWTRGPWSRELQHGGPPAALLGRALERHVAAGRGGPAPHPARLTFEFLRPVPIGTVALETREERPPGRVRLVSGRLTVDGADVLRATALFVRRAALELPPLPDDGWPRPRPPAESEPFTFPFFGPEPGYDKAMELRMAGGPHGAGPTQAWLRARVGLVPGEPLGPLARVLLAADSGNGVSALLPPRDWLFVNPDLTVNLHRLPAGEWVCLDAASVLQPTGVGLAAARLFDEQGALGTGSQSLLVDRQPPPAA
jgi:hypothetical protein